MTTIIRCLFLVLVQILVLSFATNVLSQVDPQQTLIGTWQGRAEITYAKELTLVINSVKAAGNGEWIGRGRFGPFVDTQKAGGRTEISITLKTNELYLQWTGKAGKAPVRVKLVGDSKLVGTIEAFERDQVVERRITFEKVQGGETK